jgi:hypothetical protein
MSEASPVVDGRLESRSAPRHLLPPAVKRGSREPARSPEVLHGAVLVRGSVYVRGEPERKVLMNAIRLAIGLGLFSLFAAPVGSLASGGANANPSAEETRAWTIQSHIHTLVIDAKAGGVIVTARGDSNPRIVFTNKWMFSRPEVRRFVRGGVLHVEGRCRHGRACGTYFRARVPAGVKVEVREDAAKVVVRGVPGNVSVENDVGDVELDLDRAPRRVDVQAGVGDVRIGVPRGTYAIDLRTGVGSEKVIRLNDDPAAGQAIQASTRLGDISVEGR